MNDEDEKRPGRPTDWHPSLGPGINEGHRAPRVIHSLIREVPVKKLLSRMAMEPVFKEEILRFGEP